MIIIAPPIYVSIPQQLVNTPLCNELYHHSIFIDGKLVCLYFLSVMNRSNDLCSGSNGVMGATNHTFLKVDINLSHRMKPMPGTSLVPQSSSRSVICHKREFNSIILLNK